MEWVKNARCAAGRGTTIITTAASRIATGTIQITVTTIMVFVLFGFRSTIKYGTCRYLSCQSQKARTATLLSVKYEYSPAHILSRSSPCPSVRCRRQSDKECQPCNVSSAISNALQGTLLVQ